MQLTWRVSLVGRLCGLVFAAFGVVITVAVVMAIVRDGLTMNLLFGVLVGSMFMVGPTLVALRPSVTLTESELVVRNPLRTLRIDLGDIARVEADYGGLAVSTRGGDLISAWSVQKSNAASLSGVHTRADRVVEAIRKQVDTVHEERSKARKAQP